MTVANIGREMALALPEIFNSGIKMIIACVDDIVTHGFKYAWNKILSWFRRPGMPNMFVEGDPELLDEVSYKQSVVRSTRNPYYVSHCLRHSDQVITAISVLPLREDLQSPEVEVVSGGINYREVRLRLDPSQDGQWGCDIKICGSKV